MMIKKDLKPTRQSVLTVVKATAFMLIVFVLFLFFTYLFRDTSRAGRQNILEYYEEPENSLDVVFVGTSNVLRYWDPMQAWHDHGFASYNYAAVGGKPECYLSAIKDALKTQNPDLLVVETRLFSRIDKTTADIKPGARKFLDAMDYNLDRLKAVRYYCDARNIPFKDALTLYIDLIYYHNNYGALINDMSWKLADNRIGSDFKYYSQYKGYNAVTRHEAFERSDAAATQERGDLGEIERRMYLDILDYCEENGINLLLIASPLMIGARAAKCTNTLMDIAQQRGIPFFNGNFFVDEMGLDFSRDFSDRNHTNMLGARKFTEYLGNYLKENYDLADHRGEQAYEAWDRLYEKYEMVQEKNYEIVMQTIRTKEKAAADAEKMQQTTDAYEWFALAKNSEISLMMLADEPFEHAPSSQSLAVLTAFGYDKTYFEEDDPVLIAYHDGVVFTSNQETSHNGIIAGTERGYAITVEDTPQLIVGGMNYLDEYPGGLCIVAVDHNTDITFDKVSVSIEEDGSLKLTHL